MADLSTRLTGDVLRQAVEANRYGCECAECGGPRTNWDAVADRLNAETQHGGIDPDDAWDAVSSHDRGPDGPNYNDAATALCDAIEARREPDAAPEGDR